MRLVQQGTALFLSWCLGIRELTRGARLSGVVSSLSSEAQITGALMRLQDQNVGGS